MTNVSVWQKYYRMQLTYQFVKGNYWLNICHVWLVIVSWLIQWQMTSVLDLFWSWKTFEENTTHISFTLSLSLMIIFSNAIKCFVNTQFTESIDFWPPRGPSFSFLSNISNTSFSQGKLRWAYTNILSKFLIFLKQFWKLT